jgi:hypothetical protein
MTRVMRRTSGRPAASSSTGAGAPACREEPADERGRCELGVPRGASKGSAGAFGDGVRALRELVGRQRDGASVNIAALAAGRRTTYSPLTCATT